MRHPYDARALALPALLLLLTACHGYHAPNTARAGSMPVPREVEQAERSELDRRVRERFAAEVPAGAEYRAAGAFRFVNTSVFSYIDRSDTGSAAFETPGYGVPDAGFDPATLDKESLLPRIETALRKAGLDRPDRRFASFYDELVGAARPAQLSPGFDPRQSSRLVARTASFERVTEGVPVFNSELLIGLLASGDIGRFRIHWPEIKPELVHKAVELQVALRSQSWKPPESLRQDGLEIVEMAAGVGHSGFADPGWKAEAVVRVLVRQEAKGTSLPIASTSYRYFDSSGREVRFSAFPTIPETLRARKSRTDKGLP